MHRLALSSPALAPKTTTAIRAATRAWLVSAAIGLACAMTPERLPELDRRFYHNLPTAEDQEAFLELDESERQAFLAEKGLWAEWSALSAEERKAVTTGVINVGYRAFAALMAWGPPADTQVREAGERTVEFHVFIRCTSGPKVGEYVRNNLDCDGTSSETHIAVEQGVITEIKYPN
jgi:hypothetical protein